MKITFLNVSDLHISNSQLPNVKIVLRAFFEDIRKLNRDIDFVLFNGDLINNGSLGFEGDYEYNIALEEFINPLLSSINKDNNNIFFVPGNHDINRTKINPYIDGNLSNKFSNREELNKFIDGDKQEQAILFRRLEDYFQFLEIFYDKGNKYEVSRNNLYATYIFEKEAFRIGIACLNSSWCAFGGDDDRGNLLIGERQIDNALNDLGDVDFKIAMFHHPLDWLKDFDKEAINNVLIRNFDMVCHGHLHAHDPNQIVNNVYSTIFYRCGAIFEGREFNGYAITTYDTDTGEIHMLLRQYYDRRRAFDKALDFAEEGEVRYNIFNKVSNDEGKQNLELMQKKKFEIKLGMRDSVIKSLNEKLVTSLSIDTSAPKHLKEIYVSPLLSKQPESFGKPEPELFEDLQKILSTNQNLIFVGKKEIGKTTLLNYICYYYFKEDLGTVKLPIIINFTELPQGRNIFEKAITNYFQEYSINNITCKELLEAEDIILLVDNFHYQNEKKVNKLNEFMNSYPNVKVILSMDENVLESIKIKEVPIISNKFKPYYLYSYTRNQTRQLIKNWFSQRNVNHDIILDRITKIIKTVGLPKTPLNISLLLSIIEKQAQFIPINEASLVDRFIEILLEKLNTDEIKYETLDYTIKIDYLSNIATQMTEKGQYYLEELEFSRITLDYFEGKGLDVTLDKFKSIFFKKGILIRENDKIFFRFQCFYELFVAKAMLMEENVEFRNKILSKPYYLMYQNEIAYLTGLTRKNSHGILEILEERLMESFQSIDSTIDIEKFSNLPIEEILSERLKSEELQDKLSEFTMTEEEKDEILDVKNVNDIGDGSQEGENGLQHRKRVTEIDFMDNLMLYSSVLKNLELVDKQVKKEALKKSINRFTKVIGILYKVVLDKISTDAKDQELSQETLQKYEYILKTGMPIVIQHMVLDYLGTPKLKNIIEEVIREVDTDFEKFMLISLYSDLRLDNYIVHMKQFLKINKSKIIKETATIKLLFYRFFYQHSDNDVNQLNNLIFDVKTDNSSRSKIMGKTQVINEINKRAMFIQNNDEAI
ncbi:hypothetical protein COJ48_11225 [Bacillus cereus]|nr:hypothetical protein COJ48_11225 [Bacillus cereus]PGP75153.1 hypothetical protein CN997_26280 [Bacillus cereus]